MTPTEETKKQEGGQSLVMRKGKKGRGGPWGEGDQEDQMVVRKTLPKWSSALGSDAPWGSCAGHLALACPLSLPWAAASFSLSGHRGQKQQNPGRRRGEGPSGLRSPRMGSKGATETTVDREIGAETRRQRHRKRQRGEGSFFLRDLRLSQRNRDRAERETEWGGQSWEERLKRGGGGEVMLDATPRSPAAP